MPGGEKVTRRIQMVSDRPDAIFEKAIGLPERIDGNTN